MRTSLRDATANHRYGIGSTTRLNHMPLLSAVPALNDVLEGLPEQQEEREERTENASRGGPCITRRGGL